jgi:hypothetical protein
MITAKRTTILLLTTIGLLATVYAISKNHAQIAALYWRQQLAATPDDRVEIIIDHIAKLDRAGIALLAEALGSDRHSVAQAAKKELIAQIDKWRSLSPNENLSLFTALAESLARQIESYPPQSKRDAMDLAVKMLSHPLEGSKGSKDKLLDAGEIIVQAGMKVKIESVQPKPIDIVEYTPENNTESTTGSQPPLPDPPKPIGRTIINLKTLSNNNSTSEPGVLPGVTDDDMSPGDSKANQPQLLGQRNTARSLRSVNQPSQASRISDHVETQRETGNSAKQDQKSTSSGQLRPMSYDEEQRAKKPADPALAARDVVELMRDLNSDSDSMADSVESELVRRGFSAMQIELARKLFDPSPQVRKSLVKELPSMVGIDAVPWLLKLCADTDTEVRFAAISFLATSTDPNLLNQIEQIAGRDSDANIRRIADRIVQQRNAR